MKRLQLILSVLSSVILMACGTEPPATEPPAERPTGPDIESEPELSCRSWQPRHLFPSACRSDGKSGRCERVL